MKKIITLAGVVMLLLLFSFVLINQPVYTIGNKTYSLYSQQEWGDQYLKERGCGHTALSIVMSAYGVNYSPLEIHYGDEALTCSERYSGGSPSDNRSLSVYSVAKILNAVGIKSHPVYIFNDAEAIEDITSALKHNRPVIVMCNRKQSKDGVRLAKSYHFIVLVGIDDSGNIVAINPANGKVNESHCTGPFNITVKQLVKDHMWSCAGTGYESFYFNGVENYGGYVVVEQN